MSGFVRLRTELDGEPFAAEEVLDEFYDRDERMTVQLIHRIAGYEPHAPEYTRWVTDKWIVRFGSPDKSRWYDTKADATAHFLQAKRAQEQ